MEIQIDLRKYRIASVGRFGTKNSLKIMGEIKMSTTEAELVEDLDPGNVSLAKRVLSVLTDLQLAMMRTDLDVEILMSPSDVTAWGSSRMWGHRVTEAYWVEDGHPHLELTVVL